MYEYDSDDGAVGPKVSVAFEKDAQILEIAPLGEEEEAEPEYLDEEYLVAFGDGDSTKIEDEAENKTESFNMALVEASLDDTNNSDCQVVSVYFVGYDVEENVNEIDE